MSTPAIATIGHNNPPADPIDEALNQITDLYEEAKNFADGEPIDSAEMHDTITGLYDAIHEAGKAADALRVEAKKPLDDQIKEIQDKFNPFIQPKKGKVDLAKGSLGELLAAWRRRVAAEKAAVAEAARLEAQRLADEARALRKDGDLAAKEASELLIKESAAVTRFAKQQEKGPTGLRTVWRASLEDEGAALDWGYAKDAARFKALVQQMADEAVRMGVRSVPGFVVREDKVAA